MDRKNIAAKSTLACGYLGQKLENIISSNFSLKLL